MPKSTALRPKNAPKPSPFLGAARSVDVSAPRPGDRFGRWTVVRLAPSSARYSESYRRVRVRCVCVCGAEKVLFLNDLRSGKTRGCRSNKCQMRGEAAEMVRKLAGEALGELLADRLQAGDGDG